METGVNERFSDRNCYGSEHVEVTIRSAAPLALREAIPQSARRVGLSYSSIREVVCQTLLLKPDPDNWTPIPNIRDEIYHYLDKCAWYRVYDVVEALYEEVAVHSKKIYEARLNRFLYENGIGYRMRDGRIDFRGSEVFDSTVQKAIGMLDSTNRSRAARELTEAVGDLSRRPEPDVTGAMQHAMATLEATAREVTGQRNPTFGALVAKLGLAPPLELALKKLWGYASDRARHVREGDAVDVVEAEMIVAVASAACTFLLSFGGDAKPTGPAR